MHMAIVFTRILFSILSLFFMTTYMVHYPVGSLSMKILTGICLSGTFILLLMAAEVFLKKCSLRLFNIATVGIFSGYLLGKGVVLVFDTIIHATSLGVRLNTPAEEVLKISIYLITLYLGTLLAFRFSDEFHITIPFVKFSHQGLRKKDLIVDSHLLSDSRIIDFCSHGLLNNQLIVPKFLIKDLQSNFESNDEGVKTKSKRTLEILKKLETMPSLCLRYCETDFSEIKDISQKLVRLAKLLEANIFTSDPNRSHTPAIDEVLFINFYGFSSTPKPLTPPGDTITIKIQRYGKEPKQGVGYLEDGTMVVVNNGGEYIGEIIDTQVISVKQTSAGRIIFTNAIVEETSSLYEPEPAYEGHD
jgi:uncharacterized protein YacL